ncbi:MAG: PIN domain-containing protein [Verrucomicrobiota bacterium]
MLSIDTNLLLHSLNLDSPSHNEAYDWLTSIQMDEDIAISEFVLAELYCLLRNSAVLPSPLSASEASGVIDAYRNHPCWRLIGFPLESRTLHDRMWEFSKQKSFAFRRLYDVRTALTMIDQGVTELATANVKDFQQLGFRRVWIPLKEA